jgi:acyl-CoA synthetase (AMP-forming)/AMP-acid ligase II
MSIQTNSNIVQILQQRAIIQAQETAYIFLKDGEQESKLTYQELDTKARAIAFRLQQLVTPSSRALLVYPYSAGLEFIIAFFGCLYAGVVAVPCHPPQNRLTIAEIKTRLESAAASVILTDSSLESKLKTKLTSADSSLHWLNTDKIDKVKSDSQIVPDLDQDTLAFLQYTSGSTGQPKGVMITHGCLLHNQEMLRLAFEHTQELIGVGWMPLFHDMGLIGNVIQPIYVGAFCVLMSPMSFVLKPIRWLQAISKYQATTSGAPNFAYDLLCDRVTPEQMAQLDLSSWEVAFCGAEPVKLTTLERFSHKFAVCGFRKSAFLSCYGMAEATLMITGGKKDRFPTVKYLDKVALEQNKVVIAEKPISGSTPIVSAGYPWLDGKIAIAEGVAVAFAEQVWKTQQVRRTQPFAKRGLRPIVDPQSGIECESNQIGEIWFSGSGVGKGYWQQPQTTEETFQASLDNNRHKFLRTGDLGFIYQGELYITGRLNDVLVLWGLNHYPQQIEQTLQQCHPAFKANSGAAFTVTIAGSERLVVAQEIERSYRKSLMIDDVVEAIRWTIFQQHLIDVYGIVLLQPGCLPKTSSGKVQRSVCKTKFLDQSLEIWQQWYLADVESSDVTSLIQRYTNPMTYLKMFSAIVRGKVRRFLYWVNKKG